MGFHETNNWLPNTDFRQMNALHCFCNNKKGWNDCGIILSDKQITNLSVHLTMSNLKNKALLGDEYLEWLTELSTEGIEIPLSAALSSSSFSEENDMPPKNTTNDAKINVS